MYHDVPDTTLGVLQSQFDGVCFIVDGIDGCAPVIIGQHGSSDDCQPIADAVACVGAGNFVVFVRKADPPLGLPCGTANAYRLSVSCTGCP